MSRMATPGSLLPGSFVLGRLSHADRVGLVYRAHHAENRDARPASALVLHPLHVEELREWFEKMAVLGRSLRHPNLVEVYALGYTANELPVVVTEWVEGKTARNELASGRAFPPSEVARIVREVAAALDYLHRRTPPVLHRVIMPETVLLSAPSGTVKLLSVGHADRPQHPAAKPAYLSPEELSGEGSLSPASDVFSLASFAYEILTGQVAFSGNPHTIIAAIYRGALPRLGASEGSAEVEAVLHRAWSQDPSRRFQSAGAFSDAFAGALADLSGVVTTGRRPSSNGPMRAPTFPAAGPAPVQTATGRFAAASFHSDALRTSRPFISSKSATQGTWSAPPSPSTQAPLVMASSAVAVNAQVRPSQRASGVQPSASWTPAPDTVRSASEPPDEERNDWSDEEIFPGRFDEALQRSVRLTDDEIVVGASPPPPSPRKDPLFMPAVDTQGNGRVIDSGMGGMRRHSGEFPPAQMRRNTGEFPPATRATGEFPPATRATGEFPPAQIRRTGEFPPAIARSTGEFAPAITRGTGEFPPAPVMRAPTNPQIVPRRASENPPTMPRKITSTHTPALTAGNVDPSSQSSPARTAFERDAFAPAPEKNDNAQSARPAGEVRFTWPVLLGVLVGNTVLTAILVYSLGQLLPQRAPSVMVIPQPAPAAQPAPVPVQFIEPAGTRLDPRPMAPDPVVAPSQPAPSPEVPVPTAAPLPEPQAPIAQAPIAQAPIAQPPIAQPPVAQAPVAQAPVARPALAPPVLTQNVVGVVRPRPRFVRPAIVRPVTAVQTNSAPAPTPPPRPASAGFGEPPPNPY